MKVKVPTSLKYISLEKWIQVQDLLIENNSDLQNKAEVISIICDLDFKIVQKIDIDDINLIYSKIESLLNEDVPLEHFTLNGVEYGFITDLETIPLGEYIDLESMQDPIKEMCILYRPIIKKYKDLYSIADYVDTSNSEEMKEAPASAYLAAKVFFYNLLKDCLKSIPDYLNNNLTDSELQTLQNHGVGISQLMHLQKAID